MFHDEACITRRSIPLVKLDGDYISPIKTGQTRIQTLYPSGSGERDREREIEIEIEINDVEAELPAPAIDRRGAATAAAGTDCGSAQTGVSPPAGRRPPGRADREAQARVRGSV